MGENVEKKIGPDIRILTLKRWNFPQTTRLFPSEGDGSIATGDYISYSSHHFIHIEECEHTSIRGAYTSLENLRKKQRSLKDIGIHTIQSMILLGEKGDFWDIPEKVLYISFLQLTNDAVINIDKIRKNINAIISKRAPGASWALYHSLDFCDLVLFTKGLTYDICSQAMWDLSVVRGEDLAILRDAFTIYGFRQDFLKEAFRKLDQNQHPIWEGNASLSVQLSIQSLDVWQKLENSLKEARIVYQAFRTFGRYDIRLVTGALPGEQVLKLLHLLDGMAEESADRAFGGYEITLEAIGACTIGETPTDTVQNRELEQAAAKAMKSLCSLSAKADTDSADYVDETRCSLEALLKNGFSEEFVLSVLPTFLGFLKINIEVENYRNQIRLEKEDEYRLKESQKKMTRYYFNSLNTLVLCTMHSDRQFVQAPAFNAMYFDVPPKLLTFYSAIAREISSSLKTDSDADYHFLIVPSYQRDINVRALELQMSENPSQHLAVAHLHESYFYDPILTIKLFCHEVAHYQSNRHRADRAKYIFRTVSFQLLTNTPLNYTAEQTDGYLIFDILVESLADYLLNKFGEKMTNSTRNISFHLNDIRNFLRDNNYGLSFFEKPVDIHNICTGWQNSLLEKRRQNPMSFDECFHKYLEGIQQTLRSNFLTELFRNDQGSMYCYEVFSRSIAYYASFPYEKLDNEFAYICDEILETFREAYADLRMIELIGEEFSCEDYKKLFLQVDEDSHYKYYQRILRHNAVLMTVANSGWHKWMPDDGESKMFSYIEDQIHQYLEICHRTPVSSKELVQILQDLNQDVPKQCECIRNTIQKYRVHLTDFCNSFQEEN